MRTRGRLLAALLLAALLSAGLALPSAEAAGVPQVTGVTGAGQDWYNAKLKVRWKAVAGATYQVRWAYKASVLGRATTVTTTVPSASTGGLSNRCITWYVQVRAVNGTRLGPWSVAKGIRFTNRTPAVPRYTTAGQTSTSQAQVRWKYTPYAAKYRAHWSAAPYRQWKGSNNYTGWIRNSTGSVAIRLPSKPAPKDKFIHPAYGNPVYAQLEASNGCNTTVRETKQFPVFAKPRDPGNASTGYPLAIGSYNVELFPTSAENPTKIANIADNIGSKNLDVVVLQEARAQTALDIAARLGAAEGEGDWKVALAGLSTNGRRVFQQVIYRSSKYSEEFSIILGEYDDSNPATPLPTVFAHLSPVDPDPRFQDFWVLAVHLEPSKATTIAARKLAAHRAATLLLRNVASETDPRATPTPIQPIVAAGDFQGSYGGWCDESSKPACVGEGQPTFVRAGYWDARTAVKNVGIRFGTGNKHVARPPAARSGIGGRADFILFKGLSGVARFENVVRSYGDASKAQQSDHNLLVAHVFVPYKN